MDAQNQETGSSPGEAGTFPRSLVQQVNMREALAPYAVLSGA